MGRNFVSCAAALYAGLSSVAALTPEGMISANRYGDAVPNPTGDFALLTVNKYSFEKRKSTTKWAKLDLKTGNISDWEGDTGVSEFVFIGPSSSSILYVNGSNAQDDGGVSLYFGDALAIRDAKLVASIPAPLSGLKAALTPSGDINFLLSGQAYPNGTAYNEKLATKPASAARIYTSLYPRLWDHWLTPQKNAVFGGVLKKGAAPSNGTYATGSSYSFDGKLTNYVTGICNATCAESPVDNEGDETDYDLAPDGSKLVFRSKDIDLPLSNYTSTPLYLVPFTGTSEDAVLLNPRGAAPYTDAQGYSTTPKFSPKGDKIAYFQQNGINYESDRRILYIANPDAKNAEITKLAGKWDRSPASLAWAKDGQTLFVQASDLGRDRIFSVPTTAKDDFVPKNITDEGTPAGFHVIPSGILVSDSKIWSSRDIYTVSTTGEPLKTYFQANKVDPELAGLGPEDVSEFYYSSNSSEIKQQAWVVYPEGFDKTKKYPLAFLVHGGPQGSWANSFSLRWNLKTWADQGYVVVAPNPTASFGWGQNLTDAIAGKWGSYPYWDLVHAWKYVNETLDYVDTSRGIEAGASFGGYMTNWIAGQEMGQWFKALVTHDGVTQTLGAYNSDELWFMDHDYLGPYNSSGMVPGSPYYDWNPLLYSDRWSTPHFVVHNELDYRLPVSEGILMFNMLQTKGIPSKFLSFPDEDHLTLKPENSRVWHNEIFKWINFYSGISNATSPN
ncbi:dipeptidyl-peptidase V [Apiospora arundinis]|uniref:Dipeptidyl-peptidase V n=1 Tax=Apiospora arundinis TaxID=335852 RepID=A0ABR2JIY6_9PEZI